jgi:hypothetical protein
MDHNIVIDDDPANWLLWGQLVRDWAEGKAPPTSKKELQEQCDQRGIQIKIKGKDGRKVRVEIYDASTEDKTIIIPVPHKDMINKDHAYLLDRWDNDQKRYPLPGFYRQIYQGNPVKRDLSRDEMIQVGLRRLGEYVINECM